MPTVHNTDYTADNFGTTPEQTLGFTGTAGRALIVGVSALSGTVISVTDDQANTYQSLFSTNADSMEWFMTDDCGSVTTVTPTLSDSVTPNCVFFEVSGLALAASQPQDTLEYASDGDGFVTDHGIEYTTLEPDELVLAMVRSTTGARVYTGTNGATAITTASQLWNGLHKVVSAAETADIAWSLDFAGNCSGSLISLSPAASGPTFNSGPTVDQITQGGARIRATGDLP